MAYASSERSFSESAISSTFVATPFSGQESLLKPSHGQTHTATIPFKPPQPPKLQQLHAFGVSRMNPMFQPQVEGKGPIQPHITNLPRRKGRGKRVVVDTAQPRVGPAQGPKAGPVPAINESSSIIHNEIHRRNSSPVIKPRSSSAESVRASSPSSPLSSTSPSPRSSGSSLPPSHSRPFNHPAPTRLADTTLTSPSPSVMGAKRMIALAGATLPLSLSKALPLPQPKGHIQPHLTNIPRRKRPLNYTHRPEPPPEQIREQRRKVWERRKCLEEVGGTEGVWVSFDDVDLPGEIETDEEEEVEVVYKLFEKEFEQEFRNEWVVRVCHCSDIGSGTGGHNDSDEEEDGNVLKLYIPSPPTRDDGIPHLSKKRILSAREFFGRFYSDSCSENSSSTPSLSPSSSSTPLSTSPSTLSSTSPIPKGPFARQQSKLLITIPRGCEADAMALVVVALVAKATTSNTSSGWDSDLRTLSLLTRLYDLENLGMAWRGALSCDGVEWLDEVLSLDSI